MTLAGAPGIERVERSDGQRRLALERRLSSAAGPAPRSSTPRYAPSLDAGVPMARVRARGRAPERRVSRDDQAA